MRTRIRGQRLAIITYSPSGERLLLSVPPMHPATTPAVRQRVFEYVLRRQIGLAQMTAETASDAIEGVDAARSKLASLLQETPHRNARGHQVAA